MVIVLDPKKSVTLEQAYYDCIIECNQAISNSLITAITESSDTQVINESFKSIISNIWNGIINALKKFVDFVKGKFNSFKSKFKNKKISEKVDECVSKIEEKFEDKKEEIEKMRDEDVTVTVDPAFVQAVKKRAEKKSQEATDAIRKESQSQWQGFYSAMNNMFEEVNKQREDLKKKRESVDQTVQNTFSNIIKNHKEFDTYLAKVKADMEENDRKAEEYREDIQKILKKMDEDLDGLL